MPLINQWIHPPRYRMLHSPIIRFLFYNQLPTLVACEKLSRRVVRITVDSSVFLQVKIGR